MSNTDTQKTSDASSAANSRVGSSDSSACDTPSSNAACAAWESGEGDGPSVSLEHAQKLERELTALRSEIREARRSWLGGDYEHLSLFDALEKFRAEREDELTECRAREATLSLIATHAVNVPEHLLAALRSADKLRAGGDKSKTVERRYATKHEIENWLRKAGGQKPYATAEPIATPALAQPAPTADAPNTAALKKIVQGDYADGADVAHPAIAVARDALRAKGGAK